MKQCNILVKPQVKLDLIFSTMNFLCELREDLPNDLGLRKLENIRKIPKLSDPEPSVKFPFQK